MKRIFPGRTGSRNDLPCRRTQHADRQMLAIASCTSSALTLNGLVAARPAVPAQNGLPAIVSGVSTAYAALSRPVQVGIPPTQNREPNDTLLSNTVEQFYH